MSEILYIWKYILVVPHLIVYYFSKTEIKEVINEDVMEMNSRGNRNKDLKYYLVYTKPYRNLFYYRVGKYSRLLRFFLKPYGGFFIGNNIEYIGGGAFVLNHPYGTIINAKSIGKNFTVCQLTTIGNGRHGRNDLVPTIGDNVTLGANVNIIGKITIGNNVVVGAGSVVVKDIPDNSVAVGNPATVIKKLTDAT